MKAAFLLFESISKLKVNFNKSMLFGVNVNATWLHEATSVMRCKHGLLPFMYLGLPIGGDPRKLQFWYPLVDRIRNHPYVVRNLGKYLGLNGMLFVYNLRMEDWG